MENRRGPLNRRIKNIFHFAALEFWRQLICLCLRSRLPNYPPTEFLQQNRPGIVLTSVAEPLPEAAQSLPVTMTSRKGWNNSCLAPFASWQHVSMCSFMVRFLRFARNGLRAARPHVQERLRKSFLARCPNSYIGRLSLPTVLFGRRPPGLEGFPWWDIVPEPSAAMRATREFSGVHPRWRREQSSAAAHRILGFDA